MEAINVKGSPLLFDADDIIETEEPDSYNEMRADYWKNLFVSKFIKSPGQHLLLVGRTGTGKTQKMYWLVDMFRAHTEREALVWFDIGKGAEILPLLKFWGPVRIISYDKVFEENSLTIPNFLLQYNNVEFKGVERCADVWNHIKPGRLNIAIFEPYLLDEVKYSQEISEMMKELIYRAHRNFFKFPVAIFYDEFHNVAPSQGHGFASSRGEAMRLSKAVNLIRRNVQKLRSQEIRFVSATHQWTQLHKGVRTSFEWIIPCRGASFTWEEPQLAQYNPRWQTMKTEHMYICLPTRLYGGPFITPYYTKGADIGIVDYGPVIIE